MMEILKRSLRAYAVSVIIFVALTLILACIICFSEFKESWTFTGLIAILTVDAMFLGIMQGIAVGRRGLIVGAFSVILLLIIIIGITGCIFADSFEIYEISPLYLLPVAAGSVGGAAGTNRS